MGAPRFVAVFTTDLAALVRFVQDLTPRVEMYPPDGLILEVSPRSETTTRERLARYRASLAVASASTRNCALFAARYRPGSNVEPGEEAVFLSSFPLSALSLLGPEVCAPELLETLGRWGIRTFGQLVSLPRDELKSRLGRSGSRIQQIAAGTDLIPFQSDEPETQFEETVDFDYALNALEPLSFTLGSLLEKLCGDLQARGLAAEAVVVELKLESRRAYPREVKLAVPLANPKVLLSLVRLDLQTHPPSGRIVGISVRLVPAPPRVLQHSLFEPLAPAPEKLARTLARLAALVGEKNVGSPVLLDTYRSDAFQLVPFSVPMRKAIERTGLTGFTGLKANPVNPVNPVLSIAFRRFRPPVPTQLRPDRIVVWAGPWIASGDWWTSGAWAREEWDIEFTDGTIYKAFFDLHRKKWFLDGVYD